MPSILSNPTLCCMRYNKKIDNEHLNRWVTKIDAYDRVDKYQQTTTQIRKSVKLHPWMALRGVYSSDARCTNANDDLSHIPV